MNWLDEYIANNKTGYYVGNDGSLWVDAGEKGYVREVKGEGNLVSLQEITRDDFIEKLIGGDS